MATAYIIGAELPDLPITWQDSAGDIIDFSTGWTFTLKLGTAGNPAVLTKTTGISGAEHQAGGERVGPADPQRRRMRPPQERQHPDGRGQRREGGPEQHGERGVAGGHGPEDTAVQAGLTGVGRLLGYVQWRWGGASDTLDEQFRPTASVAPVDVMPRPGTGKEETRGASRNPVCERASSDRVSPRLRSWPARPLWGAPVRVSAATGQLS